MLLKYVREMAVENPWVLRIIIGLIAVTFVVTMGWFGFEAPTANRAAVVDGTEVTMKQYQAAYNRAVSFYRQTYKDKFDEEMLRKLNLEDQIIDELVEEVLWLHEAETMGLMVTNEELSKTVTKISAFQKNGQFDSEQYRNVLSANRTNPKDFEKNLRENVLVDKVKQAIRQSVMVTDREVEEAVPTLAPEPSGEQTRSPEERVRMKQFLLFQKQEKALKAYAEGMRKKATVEINKKAL
ncbi:MAG: SurA N-terminal domain-containing protein [Nitrospirae bacterium]|nr:SurA N-terminal domain-containing protein [Nitrospirota bacterium]